MCVDRFLCLTDYYTSVCVCVCVCVCVRVCVRAWGNIRAHLCVRARVCIKVELQLTQQQHWNLTTPPPPIFSICLCHLLLLLSFSLLFITWILCRGTNNNSHLYLLVDGVKRRQETGVEGGRGQWLPACHDGRKLPQ